MNAYFFAATSGQYAKGRLNRDRVLVRAQCTNRGWPYNQDTNFFNSKGSEKSAPEASFARFLEAAKKQKLLADPVLMVRDVGRVDRNAFVYSHSCLWTLVSNGVSVLFIRNNFLLKKGDENNAFRRALLMYEFDRANSESRQISHSIKTANELRLARASQGSAVNLRPWLPSWVKFEAGTGKLG